MILVTVTGEHVQLIEAFLFECNVRLGLDCFTDFIDVARGHKAVAQPSIKRYLLSLDLYLRPIMESYALQWDGPPLRLFNKVIPYYVLFCRATLCILVNAVAAEFEVACGARALAEVERKDLVVLAYERWYNAFLFGRCGSQPDYSAELILLQLVTSVNG